MISHDYKCIFIHISKCAGSSVENAFGIDISDNNETNNKNLFGWNPKDQLFLQHATPQQLLEGGYINEKLWNTYYKFIIVRNPWERSLSDYLWLIKETKIIDSFSNFLLKKGKFCDVLNNKSDNLYRGDHLNKQKDYFFINGEEIKYNSIIRIEKIDLGLTGVVKDLELPNNFFIKKVNTSNKKYKHYSNFYNSQQRKLVEKVFKEDIDYLEYKYINNKNLLDKMILLLINN